MFKQNFIKICSDRGVAPTSVLRDIGLSNATFSCWTDESVPRQTTLVKIANYFGITVDDLLQDGDKPSSGTVSNADLPPLSPEFYNLVDQLTLKELREIQAIMEEKIKNRK
jgi:hypothetical protein